MLNKPFLIKNKIFFDKRGSFQEIYLKKDIKLSIKFTAIAYSKKNVIRGLHFQSLDKQTKVIHVVHGTILDVAVNLKKNSKNFGKVYMFKLNHGDTLVVPNSFAHGYECLSKTSTVLYHLDNYRNSKKENGISYNDKTLNIKWKTKKPIISIRDMNSETFASFKKNSKTL